MASKAEFSSSLAKACVMPICEGKKFNLVHKFPADIQRSLEWQNAIQKNGPIPKLKDKTHDAIRKRFFICARHFDIKSYKNIESRSLNLTAVPNLNLTNLNDYSLSKAYQLDQSQGKIETSPKKNIQKVEPSPETKVQAIEESPKAKVQSGPKTKVQKIDPSPKAKVQKIDPSPKAKIQQVQTMPKKNILPTILNKFASGVKTDSSGRKRSHDEMEESSFWEHTLSLRPINIIKKDTPVNQPPVEVTKVEPGVAAPPQVTTPLKSPAQVTEKVSNTAKDDPEEEPKGKLLALFEVNSAQYKRLLSVINTSSNVVVIDNAESDSGLTDNEIEVLVNEKPLKIDKFWLRDHCRCEKCYDSSTFQRRTNILDIPDDIDTKSTELKGKQLLVTWSDNHSSTYDVEFLLKNQHERLLESVSNKVLWTKEFMTDTKNICRVAMRDYMSDPDVSRKVLEGLHLYGFAFIDGVQATQQNTEFVIRQLFPIHKTLFGEMWTFSDDKRDHMDTAYTNYYLGAHNDNTYFNDASGLQILHCIMEQCTGGENFLIDGFQVAEKIKTNHPETFERLTNTMVPAEYIEKDCHHKYTAPIINLDPITREVVQIRFNTYDRAPLNTLPLRKIREFYKDLKILAMEFENPENRICFKLKPGTVLIFDNWRVLHGRHAYTGKRTMTGCYVQRSEFISVLRLNGFIN